MLLLMEVLKAEEGQLRTQKEGMSIMQMGTCLLMLVSWVLMT